MHKISLLFVMLAACELQPAPARQEAPPAPAQPTPAPAPAAPGDAAVAPAGDGGPQWSDGCKNVGMHIADVIITTTPDVAQRTIFEQDREKMVRAMAEVCTTKQWSDLAQQCYMASHSQPDLKACEKKYTPVTVPPPQPKVDENAAPLRPGQVPGRPPAGAGSGSAASKGAGAGSGSAKAH
jgi:hypothetical protein